MKRKIVAALFCVLFTLCIQVGRAESYPCREYTTALLCTADAFPEQSREAIIDHIVQTHCVGSTDDSRKTATQTGVEIDGETQYKTQFDIAFCATNGFKTIDDFVQQFVNGCNQIAAQRSCIYTSRETDLTLSATWKDDLLPTRTGYYHKEEGEPGVTYAMTMSFKSDTQSTRVTSYYPTITVYK